jgi:uncharacterized protein YjiK
MLTKVLCKVVLVSLVASLVALAGCRSAASTQRAYLDIIFPNEWVGDIDKIAFNEPSGICWHSIRKTLFVAGDEGDICEIKTDGTLVKQKHLRDADFEGITFDPSSGLLYLAVEEEEAIVEVDPETFDILRQFSLPREFEGRTLLKQGGEGLEGITFVPDPAHPQGGTFYVANQAFTLSNPQDISAIFQVEVPLRTNTGPAKIIGYFEPGVIDLSGLHCDPSTGNILAICDSPNTIMEFSPAHKLLRYCAFPGDNQEGITVDPDGFIYIAQDTGGIIKLKWLR